MTRDERILKDLTDHLREKLGTNITDYIMLCRSAELDYRETMTELLSMLITLTASLAAHQFRVAPADFAQAMGQAFAAAQKREQEDER